MPAKRSRGNSRAASKTSKSKTGRRTSATAQKKASPRSRAGNTRHAGHPLTDHEQIRSWAEERGGVPSCVKRTGGRGDIGMIRLNFPGYSGEESLQEISWEDWFQKFDENGLALLVQETTAGGEQSNFNKLVKRSTAKTRPRTRAAH